MGCESETYACFKEQLYLGGGGAGLCPACPVPGRWLHFFRVSKVSFWIPLASSPISFQYSLNLTSESWFTSKLFILSSKEPTS